MHIPLAETLRPKQFTEIVGQEHLTGKEGFLTRIVHHKKPPFHFALGSSGVR